MALQDLAQRSGFTHAVDNVVFLQLELPASQPELRELFGCQLELDDIPITPLEENEWRRSDLAARLKERPGAGRGTIGTVTIGALDRRNVTFDPDQPQKRLLTILGQETLLRNICHDGWYRYGYAFNARVRCFSVERTSLRAGHPDRIWLVRGEILSGGLIFGDQRVIDDADRQRVWPDENLRGIFFTGSELQIEVGPPVEFHQGGSLFGDQPTDRHMVRIAPIGSGPNRALLFRARTGSQADLPWGEWHTIQRWVNGIVELVDPYGPNELKPQTGWEYEIYRGERVRRFRLLGVTRNPETGAVQRAMWEQTSASAALSQLPYEPPKLPIQPPGEVADKLLDEVQKLCSGDKRISITAGASGPESASRPIVVVVDNMDGTSIRRELLRVDWKVTIDLGSGPVDWHPRTLKVRTSTDGKKQYELLDGDAVESELRGDSSNDAPDATVKFSWTLPNGPLTPTIPPTRLIGTALDADRRQTEQPGNTSRELWFQAACAASTPYAGVPRAWVNITAHQPPAVPVGDGARATRLSGPIRYAPVADWSVQAVPADPDAGRATEKPGVRLTLSSAKAATFELTAADVTLDSPPFRFYDKPINDPKSVPNERRPQDGTTKTSLRFIHRPEWDRAMPENDNVVVCKYESNQLVLTRTPQAIRIFLPAERALIDPVSVTRGNLVGRQIVAFPLLSRPTDSSKFLNVVTAQPSVNSEGKAIVTLSLELTDEEFPDDDQDKCKGFFAQLEPRESGVAASVSRVQKLKRDGTDKSKATLEVVTDRAITPGEYRLTVGPTRLALPRDVNHGLIPIGVSEFQIEGANDNETVSLTFAADKIRGEEVQSVLALHPWSEWGPRPEAATGPKRSWLTTGRVRLHHRNLIQEHAEFESSFEDRFPPEGPAKNPDGSIPSPLLPLVDFVRAVRDRYTEATGNLIAPAASLPEKAVRNWLPNCQFKDQADRALHPQVDITLDANDLTVLPEAKVKTELGISEDPFSFRAKVNGTEQDLYQSLKLRKVTEPGADQHWLDVSVRPTKLEIAKAPELRLVKTDLTDVTSRRAVDSSVPLLFSRHDIHALAAIGLTNGRTIAIVGSPEQPATVYLFDERGAIIGNKQPFPNGPLVDVVILQHNTAIRGMAIRRNGANSELVRFTVDQSTGTPTVDPTVIALTGTPVALGCAPEDPNASVFVLTTKPGIFVVNAETGTSSEIPGVDTNPTAIGVDLVGGQRYLAIGYRDGHISLRADTSTAWPEVMLGEKRQETGPVLGGPDSGVKTLVARPIWSLRVCGDPSRPIVVAVDGTRFPCVWGTKNDNKARVWLQPSDTLSVGFGRVLDLEQRNNMKNVPLFALGLRSGTVRVSAAIGRAEGLTDIRQFDTAETPITRLTLVGSDNTTKPAACFAGTSAGGLLAWDARRGLEWSEADRITPMTYLDALGVVRAVPSDTQSGDLVADRLSLGTDEYYSVTTRSLDLVVDCPSGNDAENITDIRLWADSFKVRDGGTVEPKQFPDGPFDPGHIAFFSNIEAPHPLVSMAALDHVPRLSGVPFFVTGVKTLKLNDNRTAVERAVVEGVLINPDEVGAGQDPADAGTLPGIVVRALSRCQPIEVTLEAGSWALTGVSRIDWAFAVNRQQSVEGEEGFPGAIARIVGTVSKNGDGRLSIAVDGVESRALVFGRLWRFAESVTIHSQASFKRDGTIAPWQQTRFSFKSEGDTPHLLIRSDSDTDKDNFSPEASLEVDFGNVEINSRRIRGRLERPRRVQFTLGAEPATAQLEQGGYRCLLLHPTRRDRGEIALILWTAGDLGSVEPDDVVGPLRLCAAHVKLNVEPAESQTWKLTAGTPPDRVEGTCSATVQQSLLTVTVNDHGTSKLVAQHGTILIETTLHGQQKARFLLEGNVQTLTEELTGLLILEEPPKVQATVRVKLNLDAKTIKLTDDVYWATFVKPETNFPEPEILMPRLALNSTSTQFSVNRCTPEPVLPVGFVRIGLKKVGDGVQMGIRRVDSSLIPLLPELEPSLVQAPDRIGSNDVRLAHRLRAGLALRPNAPLDRFGVALAAATSGDSSVPAIPPDQGMLLDTVVSTAGPLVRLRPEGWLLPQPIPTDKYRTDGLFVLNVDFRRDDIPVVAAIEARTWKFSGAEPDAANETERYRDLLRAAGSQGVAITYRLIDGQMGELSFVPSPFYDHPGETGPARLAVVAANGTPVGLTLAAPLLAVSKAATSWVYGSDPRFQLPRTLSRAANATTGRYVVADSHTDPYADICCLAHRQYRLERVPVNRGETFDPSETPMLHNAEVPAFRQPARLSSPLSGRWLRTEPANPFVPRLFFPPRVDWELAADKPGAMFQSVVQARVTKKDGETRHEPLIDFALREPQFVRLAGCVTAEVIWQDETAIAVSGDWANVTLVWTEVIGSVQVDNETSDPVWLRPSARGIALSRTPLQLVIDFNSEVLLVNPADAAVPAYRVEAQPDNGVPPVKVLPAATYLVANPDLATVFKPQTVAEGEHRCTITNGGGVWKATVDGATIQSGTALILAGFSQTALNNVAHRFVGSPAGPFELMQDTATEDSVSTITVESTSYNVTVLCRRPLCVEINGKPTALNGKPVTIAELSGKVRRLQDGSVVGDSELRLAQVVPDTAQYLIATPTRVTSGGTGTCRLLTTQADGYLEAAIRIPAKVAADTTKAWTPALTLPAATVTMLNLVGEHELIRLESKNPGANGVFGVLGTNLLARPVVGNGDTVTGEGTAIAFLEVSPTTYQLAEVDGSTPIAIRLQDQDGGTSIADPNWDEGKAIAIRGITTVPQANGIWVVRKLADYRYELYQPTIAETGSEIDAVASAVIPLREAFPLPQTDPGPRLSRLELEPSWKPTDRPLLQVHWAGTGQFPTEDGKGIAWRPGGVMVGLYEQAKQVKFLANSQLSPKLAFVMTAPAGTSWQRTILFGDSAPPFKAEPSIETVQVDGITTTHFYLKIPNNRESLSVPVPQGVSGNFVLHLVKSMPSGVAVYDKRLV